MEMINILCAYPEKQKTNSSGTLISIKYMYRNLYILLLLVVLTACCKDENLSKSVVWKNRICGNNLIEDHGIGYPIYNNTVIFHSTPVPINSNSQSVLYGLDTKTGKEKWRLTNLDFYSKKDLQFNNVKYYYQYKNIFVGADFQYKDFGKENYFYGIDIETGKVLWIKEFHSKGLQFGRMVRGIDKYAYVDYQKDTTEFSLIQINIETGVYSEAFTYTNQNLPNSIPEKNLSFCEFSDIYKNSINEEFIACCFDSYNSDRNRNKSYMTLLVYNLTKKQIEYSTYVNSSTLETEWDDVSGHICYNNGEILIGKGKNIYCYDAFIDKGNSNWQHTSILNDGVGFGSGNDYVVQILAFNNILLAYCIDHLIAFDVFTGQVIYNVPAAGTNDAALIDGIIYQREHSDLQMRDPKTGKELKRIATGKNEQAFSSSRPNGADGKIFVHTYTDAYCIRAWGK